MTEAEFAHIQHFLLKRTGIVISSEKRYLVETRIEPLCRQHRIGGLAEVVQRLRLGDRAMETLVIDAMTTNETLFFRDRLPFEVFEQHVLPNLISARKARGKIRIWCAACSTGQEPYSLAMILDEHKAALRGIEVEILATDISERVLEQAREATYSQFEVQRGLPVKQLMKYFTQEGLRWKLSPEIARQVTFRNLNLLDSFRHLGAFDFIMCRNVLIYFNEQTKRDIYKRLAAVMEPDSSVIFGGAESILGLSEDLAMHKDVRTLCVPAASPLASPFGQLFRNRSLA